VSDSRGCAGVGVDSVQSHPEVADPRSALVHSHLWGRQRADCDNLARDGDSRLAVHDSSWREADRPDGRTASVYPGGRVHDSSGCRVHGPGGGVVHSSGGSAAGGLCSTFAEEPGAGDRGETGVHLSVKRGDAERETANSKQCNDRNRWFHGLHLPVSRV
jgi:hypothetical protein